jgi:cyclic pyranopterin phosphate synthase
MALPVAQPRNVVADAFARPMTDLRISVTDRCNFRCVFCMPSDRAYRFLPRPQILTFEEVTRLARVFVGLGVEKIRLTGGEPLLRAEIEKLVAGLAAIEPCRDGAAGRIDLAMTTNAYLLPQKAAVLRRAGLGRVTVSLHSLDAETFGRINGLGVKLEAVLAGIDAALAADLRPVKLNVVVLKGTNDREIVDLARFGRDRGCAVRFIEYMDVGTVNAWDPDRVISAREILERIDRVFPLEPSLDSPLTKSRRGEVAERYRYRDGAGEVGVIPSVTQPFCGDCTRVRLSADGELFTCLFAAAGHDLKGPLRAGASDGELAALVRSLWRRRTDRYSEERTAALRRGRFAPAEKVEMFRIGG